MERTCYFEKYGVRYEVIRQDFEEAAGTPDTLEIRATYESAAGRKRWSKKFIESTFRWIGDYQTTVTNKEGYEIMTIIAGMNCNPHSASIIAHFPTGGFEFAHLLSITIQVIVPFGTLEPITITLEGDNVCDASAQASASVEEEIHLK